ncbi:hypothetical protein J437_LFUL019380 [Ladona fulva]|uniref:Uncharacterized protein n=1 Tax=Ladona fulva TaxID=123851 RepID=A0A8K0KR08_LADFU|nr:hypothetical protein J437_LFUL019380 [Ladona fulva]
MDMTNIRGQSEMMLAAWATTVNNETNQLDNIWKGKVQLKNEADITIFGKGVPEISSVALEGENETESKISFIHYYEVQKFGFSQVEEVSIELLLPMYIKDKRSKEQIKFLTLRDYKGYQGRQMLPCSLSDSMDLDDEIKTHSISKRFTMENTSNISRSEVSLCTYIPIIMIQLNFLEKG